MGAGETSTSSADVLDEPTRPTSLTPLTCPTSRSRRSTASPASCGVGASPRESWACSSECGRSSSSGCRCCVTTASARSASTSASTTRARGCSLGPRTRSSRSAASSCSGTTRTSSCCCSRPSTGSAPARCSCSSCRCWPRRAARSPCSCSRATCCGPSGPGSRSAAALLLNPTYQWLTWEFFHPDAGRDRPLAVRLLGRTQSPLACVHGRGIPRGHLQGGLRTGGRDAGRHRLVAGRPSPRCDRGRGGVGLLLLRRRGS